MSVRWRHLTLSILCWLAVGMAPISAQPTDAIAFPRPPLRSVEDWGCILDVAVKFGSDGRVEACDSKSLYAACRSYTLNFIRENWVSKPLAGKTIYTEIVHGMTGPVLVDNVAGSNLYQAYSAPASLGGILPHPAYPLQAKLQGIQGSFEVSVFFDQKGQAVKCRVFPPTAPLLLAKPTCSFILDKWFAPSLAGRTETVPFAFVLKR